MTGVNSHPLWNRAVFTALSFTVAMAVVVWGQDASPPRRDDVSPVVEAARQFLEDWFVKRDVERAQGWFADAAYQHNTLLNAECSGFSATDLKTEATRRAALRTYLRDSLPDVPAKSLTDVVSRRATAELATSLGKRVVNEPAGDHFVVTSMDRNDRSLRGAANEELRSILPSTFFLMLVSFDGGALYFFWVPERAGWRIVHANQICV